MSQEKEFRYTDQNFQFLKKMAKQLAGINLADTKNEMVYSRVSRLLRQNHFNNFDDYCASLKQNNPKMINEFVNAITTNFTSFMREENHFAFLKEAILPDLLKKTETNKIRIWSAGCSTGEEAYSLSFVVTDFFKGYTGWDIKILATDIDSDALLKGEQGIYSLELIDDLPEPYHSNYDQYFDYSPIENVYSVKNKYRKFVYFKNFNLMQKEQWPMSGPFDVIFCRNVLIYFDRASQYEIIYQLSKLLSSKGYLILGHSESFSGAILKYLKFIKGTIYQKETLI